MTHRGPRSAGLVRPAALFVLSILAILAIASDLLQKTEAFLTIFTIKRSCCNTAGRDRFRQAVTKVCFAAIGLTVWMSAMSSKAAWGQMPTIANDL